MRIERVDASAWRQDPTEEVRRVREELRDGDESWARWLAELERGEAVVASMRVAVHLRLPDGTLRTVEAENHDLWLEVETHAPSLEAQVQDLSSKDAAVLADRLCELGAAITADDLSRMYVHVELAEDLRGLLRPPAGAAEMDLPLVRLGVGTETGADA
jgi:hypothetical protein